MQIVGVRIIAVKAHHEKTTDQSVKCHREKAGRLVFGGEASEAITVDIAQDHQNIRSEVERSVLIENEAIGIVAIDMAENRDVNLTVLIVSIKKATADHMEGDIVMVVSPLIALIRIVGTDVEGGGGTKGRSVMLSVFTVLETKLSSNTGVEPEVLCGLMQR